MTKTVSKSFGPLLVLTGDIEQDVMLPLVIEVRLDVSSLKFDAHGRLVKAEASFEAAYNPARLKGVEWDRMFGDEALLKSIEGHLEAMGFAGGLAYKSFDQQRSGLLRLHMKPRLVASMFPDAVAEAARARRV